MVQEGLLSVEIKYSSVVDLEATFSLGTTFHSLQRCVGVDSKPGPMMDWCFNMA